MAQSKAAVVEKKPAVIETALVFRMLGDGSLMIEKLKIQDDRVTFREVFAQDMAQIVMSRLDQTIRHALLTGGSL